MSKPFKRPISIHFVFRAMVPLVPDRLPNLSGMSIFLSSGLQDPIVTKHEAETLSNLLKRAGANVTLQWHRAGHELTIMIFKLLDNGG